MGVERFFSSVYKQFNVIKNIYKPYPTYKTDHLLIDFNSIIHTITSVMDPKDIKDIKNIFKEIEKYLKNLLFIIQTKKVYIAVDGVPSLAKMLEQKKRRYLGEIINDIVNNDKKVLEEKERDNDKKEKFEKILISPATKFMEELMSFLKNIKIEDVDITISDYNEEGEGEMKIIRYIKKNNLDNIFVYSPDSDMILLLSMLELKNLILFRHDQKNSKIENGEYEYVYNYLDVNSFKKVLIDYVKSKKIINFNNQKIINDIIYIFTLFGNDFLPKVESLKVESDLFILIDCYLLNFSKYSEYIIDDYNDYNDYNDYKNLFNFIKLLSRLEYIFINRNVMDYLYINYDINFRNKFIYDIKHYKFENLNLYHYQMLKYIDWSKILKNPLDYLKMDEKSLQYYLVKYIRSFSRDKDIDIFLGDISSTKTTFKIELKKQQSIKDKYHQEKTNSYSIENKIRYQIEYKLDNYSKIFNTKDAFYETLKTYKTVNSIKDSYNNLYHDIYDITDSQIKKYLDGWLWIMEYYFKDSKSNLFGYFYHKAPLLKDIVNYYETNKDFISNSFKDLKYLKDFKYHPIKPIELLLYITPFRNNKDMIAKTLEKLGVDVFYTDLIFNNENFIFIEDINEKSIDCTSSIFTSKCHYIPLNREIDIFSFIDSIAKKVPLDNSSKTSRKSSKTSRKSSKTSRKSSKSSKTSRKSSKTSRKSSKSSKTSRKSSKSSKTSRKSSKSSKTSRKSSKTSRKSSKSSRKSSKTSRKSSKTSL